MKRLGEKDLLVVKRHSGSNPTNPEAGVGFMCGETNPHRIQFGCLAQLGEHLTFNQAVCGSIPQASIYLYFVRKKNKTERI